MFLLLYLLPRKVKKAVFCNFHVIVLSITTQNTQSLYTKVTRAHQFVTTHRSLSITGLVYIQQQGQQHLRQPETNTSCKLTSDGVTISLYSPEMNTSIAKANTSKSTCQVHVGSCFTVFRVSDGSVHHGANGTNEFTNRLVIQEGKGRGGFFMDRYTKNLKDELR